MGQPAAESTQSSITNQQLSLEQQQQGLANQEYQQSQTLEAPLIAQEQALISGNPGATNTALAPYISSITGNQNQAIENIQKTVPTGAAQQYAESMVPLNEATQIAGTTNSLVNNAYSTLSQLGIGQQNFSLQNTGAALSGLSGASQSNQASLQAQEQQKASTLGFIGSLVGSGTSLLSGGLLGGGGGSGGGGGMSSAAADQAMFGTPGAPWSPQLQPTTTTSSDSNFPW